jgi:serine phosphatase RsbU (regulator of sigma subunit)
LGLKPDASGQGGNDGMDCACICIDFDNLKLDYAGANNPIWIFRNNELIEIKPDKMPVGRSPKQDIEFSSKDFQLEKDDCIYLFSDGYPDQFGGPKGKKFKYKAFEELILQHVNLPMDEQKKLIENKFNTWKGDLEQVDDVCIIGIRL